MYGFHSQLRHIYPLEIISTHPIDEDDEIWTLEWDSIPASCLTDGLKFLLRLSPSVKQDGGPLKCRTERCKNSPIVYATD